MGALAETRRVLGVFGAIGLSTAIAGCAGAQPERVSYDTSFRSRDWIVDIPVPAEKDVTISCHTNFPPSVNPSDTVAVAMTNVTCEDNAPGRDLVRRTLSGSNNIFPQEGRQEPLILTGWDNISIRRQR